MTLCANYYETGSLEIDEVHSEKISSNAVKIALARTGGGSKISALDCDYGSNTSTSTHPPGTISLSF